MTIPTSPPKRRPLRIALTIAVAIVAAVAVVIGGWFAFSRTADASPAAPDDAVQDGLEQLVDAGFPAALAAVTIDGKTVNYAAGFADVDKGIEAEPGSYVRIGSNTKMFVSTVVLQLSEEGLVDLDASIDTYLPGLVVGEGIDASAITVRQLLQHTSGLPEYTADLAMKLYDLRDVYLSPRDVLDRALVNPAASAPGETWSYNNTGYILLGLLIERVTERPLFEVVNERIVERLGLEETEFPSVGERDLPSPHPIGYHIDNEGNLVDLTRLDPSWGWAAGAIVATPGDLNKFMVALVGGELIEKKTLDQMMTTMPAQDLWEGAEYGLGLIKYPLECGGVAWGHGGDIAGFETRNAVTEDGRAATVAVTALPWATNDFSDEEAVMEDAMAVNGVLETALCAPGVAGD